MESQIIIANQDMLGNVTIDNITEETLLKCLERKFGMKAKSLEELMFDLAVRNIPAVVVHTQKNGLLSVWENFGDVPRNCTVVFHLKKRKKDVQGWFMHFPKITQAGITPEGMILRLFNTYFKRHLEHYAAKLKELPLSEEVATWDILSEMFRICDLTPIIILNERPYCG